MSLAFSEIPFLSATPAQRLDITAPEHLPHPYHIASHLHVSEVTRQLYLVVPNDPQSHLDLLHLLPCVLPCMCLIILTLLRRHVLWSTSGPLLTSRNVSRSAQPNRNHNNHRFLKTTKTDFHVSPQNNDLLTAVLLIRDWLDSTAVS